MDKTKILVITVSSWNSRVGANTWTSLLQNYDSSNVANICIRDEIPDSPVCSRYFVISENRILKSILKRNVQTGREVEPCESSVTDSKDIDEHNERYRKMRKKRRYSMLLAREIVWKIGKWRTKELDEFLDSFKPDIILHSMEGYIHLNRIVEYSIIRTGAKAIGYIWDDNFTYKQSNKWGYKVYRFFQRKSLKKLAKRTSRFFAISPMTKIEADAFFGIDCEILTKPLNRTPIVEKRTFGKPIRMLYTGNLLIGRDRSLLKVVKIMKERFSGDFVVDVYTQTILDEVKRRDLECGGVCRIHAPIPQSDVLKKQMEADILLFLEDIDGPNANIARLSFSTKITDYLSAGKAIFAVGNKRTAPMQYLIQEKAAIVASSDDEIVANLKHFLNDSSMINEYAQGACAVGVKNHSMDKIQQVFYDVLMSVLPK